VATLNNDCLFQSANCVHFMDVRHSQLSANLVYLRTSMNLSRQSLARIVGSSAAHIGKLESGKTQDPSWRVIERLSRFFGVSSRTLMEAELENIDRRDQAIARAHSNFTDAQWDSLIDFVDGTTRRQAENGLFRNS